MFLIRKDDAVFAFVENPVWIKRLRNGCFGIADREHATGVVIASTPYSISDSEDMSMLEKVFVEEVDGGSLLAQYMANLDYLSAMTGFNLPEEEEPSPDEEAQEQSGDTEQGQTQEPTSDPKPDDKSDQDDKSEDEKA